MQETGLPKSASRQPRVRCISPSGSIPRRFSSVLQSPKFSDFIANHQWIPTSPAAIGSDILNSGSHHHPGSGTSLPGTDRWAYAKTTNGGQHITSNHRALGHRATHVKVMMPRGPDAEWGRPRKSRSFHLRSPASSPTTLYPGGLAHHPQRPSHWHPQPQPHTAAP